MALCYILRVQNRRKISEIFEELRSGSTATKLLKASGNVMKQNKILREIRVLVIDDNTEITDMLSFYLESLGNYECKVVNEGKNGLQVINSETFDIIMLDLAMPEFSGMDIIKSLKKDNLLIKRNIIVLTASTLNDELIAQLLSDGVKAVLKKPISIDELQLTMQQFV